MESTTTTTRTLEIDGMSGDACVQEVTGALKSVHGVTTQSVKVGAATIRADQAGCTAACAAIGAAGYPTREDARNGAPNGSPRATVEIPSGQKAYSPAQKPAGDNSGRAANGTERPGQNAPTKLAGTPH